MGKEKLFSEGLLCVALLAGLAFGVAAGAAIYASAYPIFQSDSWATWAAAFGTFSAAMVALHIAQQDRRQKHSKDVMRARLLAPRVAIKIAGVRTDLSTFYAAWSETPDCFLDEPTRAHAAEWADWARNEFLMPDLEMLSTSPTRCAEHLVSALSFLDMFSGLLGRTHPDPDKHRQMLADALPNAERAIIALGLARADCLTWKKWR